MTPTAPTASPAASPTSCAQTAAAYPRITKLVRIGKTVQGQDILALKVTRNARQVKDGKRPSVLYGGAQHAREWITPEMVRRLMHHYLDGYGRDPQLTRLINTTELWFLPVSNPDGYDYTFSTERLWRKNLQDNDADGQITANDGVDPNRNFAVKWGWDNEGSSTDQASETYRGSGPNSEPETQALDSLFDRVGFEFYINYHSAAELLLYGIGWQVSTPSPDDVIYEAMAGDDEDPAVPGYDPDISAELYTTNGDTDTHATVEYGTLGFTPEMTTCETVSASIPDDEWEPEDCISGFNFPDDEELIQAEFEKNIPFALAVAQSTHDPDDPVSVVGRTAADMVSDPFSVSYGRPRRSRSPRRRRSRTSACSTPSTADGPGRSRRSSGGAASGTATPTTTTTPSSAARSPAPPPATRSRSGSPARKPGKGWVSSKPFTYQVADDIRGDVLILAAEDVTGVSPAQGLTSASYADDYAAALSAAGYTSDVYDVDVNGRTAPHHLGVLSHYDAIVWESGDDIITRAAGQPGGTADKLSLDLELAVRDYLNEGGKALVTGQYNQFAQAANGVYDYNPFAPPQCTTVDTYPCLPLANDFLQYWLGAYNYVSDGGTSDRRRPRSPSIGGSGEFDGLRGHLQRWRLGRQPGPHRVAGDDVEHPARGRLPAVRQLGARAVGPAGCGAVRPVHRRVVHVQPVGRPGLEADDPHGRPHRGDVRRAELPAVPRHRARLGLRRGRGPRGRHRQLDHAAGRQRPHPAGHRRLLRRGLDRRSTRSWSTTRARTAPPPAPRASGTRPAATVPAGRSGAST